MATTYNFRNGSITGQPKVNDTLPNTTGIYSRSNIVDFANQNIDSGEADVAQVLNVPADTWVLYAVARLITAESDDAQMNLGNTDDMDRWINDDGVDAADLAGTGGNSLIPIVTSPSYYASAGTVDIRTGTNDVDYDTLKVEVIALLLPGNQSDTDGKSQHST